MTTAAMTQGTGTRPLRIVLATAANGLLIAGATLLAFDVPAGGLALLVAFPILASISLGLARRDLMSMREHGRIRPWIHVPALLGGLALAACIAVIILVVKWPLGFAEAGAGVLFFTAMLIMYEMEIGGAREVRTDEEVASQTAALGFTDAEFVVLRDSDMLRALTAAQAQQVIGLGNRRKVSEGESLGEAGRLGEKVYVVLEGQAQLSANTGFGPMTVRVAGPGESFPMASLVGYGMLVTSVRAMTGMTVWELDRSRLLDLCQERPEIGARIFAAAAKMMAERYRNTLKRLTHAADQARAGAQPSITV
ncbi:MAG: cyclic nucleotide-binding domain-containing protein [Chloroflexi bacterium]|nr:cyclic nucleotide-binding domain-containing protein [Chloroflexota bacterium]